MKKILVAGLMLIFLGVAAQKQGTRTGPPVKLKNYQDSIQYAVGAYIGNYLAQGGFTFLSMDYFLAGLNDTYRNLPRLIKDSIAFALISGYQEKTAAQLSKVLEAELINALKDKPGVGKLPSGVQYLVLKPGTGAKPLETDSIVIHYKGTLANGTVFENTFLRNMPVVTTPATLIPALNEVLQLMPVGSTWQIFVPSAKAYGDKGNGTNIPPNSALLFALELVEIRKH